MACSPTRKLADSEYLLVKNTLKVDSGKVDKDGLAQLIRQRPNRRILGFYRFHLQVWSLVDQEKVAKRADELELKNDARNKRRMAKGKEPKERRRSFGEWLMEIGEEPVVYDQLLTMRTSEQLAIFMQSKGYFRSTVTDTVVFKRKRARVTYSVNAGPRYSVRNADMQIDDEPIGRLVRASDRERTLRSGDPYDADVLQTERERIARLLKGSGYYAFNESDIRFQVDTAAGTHQVDVRMLIEGNSADTAQNDPSMHVFKIRHVYVSTDYDQKNPLSTDSDTMQYNGIDLIYRSRFKHRPEVLLNKIFLQPGDIYRVRRTEMTYQMLSGLKAFRYVNVSFREVRDSTGRHLLDAFVQLTPSLKQTYTVEAQGTNREGNLGVSGNLIFQNRNLFRGAEMLELRIKGGLEYQVLTQGTQDENISGVLPFNTLEIGPELSLNIPKFILPFKAKFLDRYGNPSTYFKVAYNYQQRPDFTRSVFNATYGYRWTSGQFHKHQLNPVEVNFVNIYNESDTFKTYINLIKDKLLRNTFRPHLTTLTNYTYTFNNQRVNKHRNFTFLRVKLESSGNVLRGIMSAAQAKKDSTGSYTILGVPFAQYLKYEVDLRRYVYLNAHSQVVFRFFHGLGYPLLNLGVMPFENSFFAGGANGIRAWRPRTLGPGSHPSDSVSIDQFGDIKLEFNIEYRFDIYRWFKGAVFTDAGNIWLMKTDVDRPAGNFEFGRFYKEIAWGGGLGLRLDLNFFVIRLDAAMKFHDPGEPEGQRWVADTSWQNINFNLGIGYPF